MILRMALTVWWKSYGTTGGGGGADGSGMSDGTDATTNPNSVSHLLMKEHTMNPTTHSNTVIGSTHSTCNYIDMHQLASLWSIANIPLTQAELDS